MIAIDTRPGSPFAGFWRGADTEAQRQKFWAQWDGKLLAWLLVQEARDIPIEVLYDVINQSTSHRVDDWLREARGRLKGGSHVGTQHRLCQTVRG